MCAPLHFVDKNEDDGGGNVVASARDNVNAASTANDVPDAPVKAAILTYLGRSARAKRICSE